MGGRLGLPLAFSCVGHALMHMFAAFFFVIVLGLEGDWALPYHELIGLWTLGALLVGAGALPAGWLGDRWSARGMMVVFFIGIGGASVLCGLAETPTMLLWGLAAIGLFASIYHPVGIPWLIRSTGRNRGKMLGINGIFGGLGVALAGLVAGALIDLSGWRAAFVVPGVFSIATGLALLVAMRAGLVPETAAGDAPEPEAGSRGDMLRAFLVLMLTMFLGAIIYQSTQASLPKVFDLRLVDLAGDGVFGIGVIVAGVYAVGGLTQVVGGHFADRYPLKTVYAICLLVQAPLLFTVAGLIGLPLIAVAVLMVSFNAAALPAENMLLARWAPKRHHGLAFGAKFVVSFGSAPLALLIVSAINERTGGFSWLYLGLGGVAVAAMLAALLLPPGRAVPAPLPAE